MSKGLSAIQVRVNYIEYLRFALQYLKLVVVILWDEFMCLGKKKENREKWNEEKRNVDHLTYLGRWTVSVDVKNTELSR